MHDIKIIIIVFFYAVLKTTLYKSKFSLNGGFRLYPEEGHLGCS